MTGIRVDTDPLEQLKALRAQRSSAASDDPLEQLKATRAASQPNPAGDQALHAEFRSGALAKRMASENARDSAAARGSGWPSGVETFARYLAEVPAGIPGGRALSADLRSMVRGQPYRDAYNDLESQSAQLSSGARFAAHLAGAGAVMPLLPGGIAMQGAALGAGDELLDANPDESWRRRALGTAVGAGAGAVGGAALEHVAAPIARGAAGAVTRGLDRIEPKVGASVGSWLTKIIGMGPTTDEAQARAMLAEQLRTGGSSPAALASTVPLDRPTAMMELGEGNRNVASLARTSRNVPTAKAGQTIDRFLNGRSADAGRRIEQTFTDVTGHKATDTALPTEQFIAKASAEAKPLYQKAYAYGQIQDPETVAKIQGLRKADPVFERAWQRGQNIGRVEGTLPKGTPATPASTLVDAAGRPLSAGSPAIPANPTVRDVDLWKRGLDAVIQSGFGSENAISRTEARAYRNALNEVLGRVDTEVPDFKAARGAFAGNAELSEAAEAGADHFKPSTPSGALERQIAGMSPSERAAYVNNARNELVHKIRIAAANPDFPELGGRDIAKTIFTGENGERIGMLFDTEADYQNFVERMRDEAKYPGTKRFLSGQSQTTDKQAESATTPAEWMGKGVKGVHAATHPFRALAGAADAARRERIPKLSAGQANAIADQTTATGARLKSILEQMDADVNARELGRRRLKSATRGTAIGAVTGGESWRDQVNSLRNEP